MMTLRKASDRGHGDHGWLKSWHTFSFSTYQDPQHVRFRSLRVMNEDRIAPGPGFGTHPHHDMEIVTYILDGALEHRDSMGNGEILRAGEFQRMTAGTGITHSEFNPSQTEEVHLYQIWLFPERKGLEPSYEQRAFPAEQRQDQLQLVASPTAENNSLKIHQDARIFLAHLSSNRPLDFVIPSGRHVWLQVLRGNVAVQDHSLSAGDGLAISDESSIVMRAVSAAEIMLFDLA